MLYLVAAILGIFLRTPEHGDTIEVEADIVVAPH